MGFHGLRTDTAHHGPDEGPGREVLPCAAFHVLRVFLEQSLIDLALHIGGHGHPPLLINHLHDAVQDGGVADLVYRALENLPQDAALFPQFFQSSLVLLLQLRALEGVHIRPSVSGGDAGFPPVRRLGVLVRHFQENQVSQLLQIVAVGHTVVPQGVAHTPDFGNDGGGLVKHVILPLLIQSNYL